MFKFSIQYTFEKTEGATNNGQSRDTGIIGLIRHRTKKHKTKQKCTTKHRKLKG